MKKIYIILFIIVFAIGFKAGDYESGGKYKHLAINTEIFFKNLFSKNKNKIPQKKIKQLDNIKILKANSFDLKVENFLTIKDFKKNTLSKLEPSKTAAFQMNKINGELSYKIFLQNGLIIDNKKNIERINLPYSIYRSFNGGVKSVFTVEENEYALIINKKKNCFYTSIINLSNSEEIFKSTCLPVELENKANVPDFNGIGGATMLLDDYIYLTIGAPESLSQKIRELAQVESSIFGKIIKISKKDLLKPGQKNLNYSIYSTGHRNPQGIVEVNNNIFSTEHGPQGGDELNLIIEGKNYGWPLKSYGTRYRSGKSFKYSKKIDNYQEPIYSFVPSIAPSSLSVCPNNLKNYYLDNICLMSLSLRGQSVFIILLDDDSLMVQSIEQIKLNKRLRHFAVDENIKTFFNNNSFYVSTDSGTELNILRLSFLNFR